MSTIPGPVDAPDMMEIEEEEPKDLSRKKKSTTKPKPKRPMSQRQLESLAMARAAKRRKRESLLEFGDSRDNLWQKMGTMEKDMMDIDTTLGDMKEKLNMLEGGYKTMKDLYPTFGGNMIGGDKECQVVPSNDQLANKGLTKQKNNPTENNESIAEHAVNEYGYISRTIGGLGIGILGVCAAAYLAKRAEQRIDALV